MAVKSYFSQMIRFQKTLFDNAFVFIDATFSQPERWIGLMAEQYSWIPAPAKGAVDGSIRFSKRVRSEIFENLTGIHRDAGRQTG